LGAQHKKGEHMELDYLTILAATCAGFALLGLAWLGGYDLGQAHGISSERELADRRIKPLLDRLNKMKPTTRKRRAK
jgi:hypothetical protein